MWSAVKSLKGPLARNLCRYIAGLLIAHAGWSASSANDLLLAPGTFEIAQMAIGVLFGVIAEAYWWAAKRFGWNT